jgi:hypothetical protein
VDGRNKSGHDGLCIYPIVMPALVAGIHDLIVERWNSQKSWLKAMP